MSQDTQLVRSLHDIRVGDVAVAGGKGANLGELLFAGAPVPPGFVITSGAFAAALDAAGVRDDLRISGRDVDVDDPSALAAAAQRMQELVRKAGIPDELRDAIVRAYADLGGGRVAVRSSATAEDSAGTSFAGMNETFTNVTGDDGLLARVVDCWASLFGPRVVAYRATQQITDEPLLAVVVQTMVPSDRSGVMFTTDPTTGDDRHLVIEGAFGLGEVVVSGSVEPDTYVVDKAVPRLLSAHVGVKDFKIVTGAQGDERQQLPPEEAHRRVLDDETVLTLARLGARIADHYGAPQDIEWATVDDTIWIVQSRPITTLGRADAPPKRDDEVLVAGLAAAPGVASGPVSVLRDRS
jgi:pyruvate,water dikinase